MTESEFKIIIKAEDKNEPNHEIDANSYVLITTNDTLEDMETNRGADMTLISGNTSPNDITNMCMGVVMSTLETIELDDEFKHIILTGVIDELIVEARKYKKGEK